MSLATCCEWQHGRQKKQGKTLRRNLGFVVFLVPSQGAAATGCSWHGAILYHVPMSSHMSNSFTSQAAQLTIISMLGLDSRPASLITTLCVLGC